MKKIRDWLPDWTLLHSDESLARDAGLTDLLDREVDSVAEALGAVNRRIDFRILWHDALRPTNPEPWNHTSC